MAKVRVIPAKKQVHAQTDEVEQKRKVAAYARVSTDSDEQLNSYEAQISHYTDYIKNNKAWRFAGVYTDEGISGLRAKNREGFQRMIKDSLAGKIDLIITKSVSRFARNTVDTLTNVRKLKERGIEIYFEKENIWTLDSKGELLITIMSSLAQEESRSLSENVTWGQRKRFSDGKVSMPYGQFLGFERSPDGKPQIIEEEAVVVRKIYRDFLSGMSYSEIKRLLENDKVLSPSGKSNWSTTTIKSILTNEKYMGDALLQKSFTTDFLTKRVKVNEGEVPQYYVRDSHEAIVSEEVFEMVQAEVERRGHQRRKSTAQFFSGQLVCGDCGSLFIRKVWHSTSKYKRYVWQCGHKYSSETVCTTPHLTDDRIKSAFVALVNNLLREKDSVLAACQQSINEVLSTEAAEVRLAELNAEIEETYDALHTMIQQSGKQSVNDRQTEIDERYLMYEAMRQKTEALQKEISGKQRRKLSAEHFIKTISSTGDIAVEFDEALWRSIVEDVVVRNKDLCFNMRNGEQLITD